MSDRQLQLDDRDARTNGKSQVRPHPTTHGQTLLNGNETPVSFRLLQGRYTFVTQPLRVHGRYKCHRRYMYAFITHSSWIHTFCYANTLINLKRYLTESVQTL